MSIGVNGYIIASSSIAPLFIETFSISQSQAGWIVSAAILGMILAQFPSGYIMDRYDNRWLIVGFSILYALVVVVQQFTTEFSTFLALHVLGGFFGGFVFVIGANIVGDVFPSEYLGLATGIYVASPSVSWAIAHSTGPMIGPAYGPLRVYALQAAITVAGVVVFWFIDVGPVHTSESPSVAEYLSALRNPAIILVGLSGFSSYALYVFLNSWLPTYGTDVLSLPLAAAGLATAVVPIAGVVARPSGGWISGLVGNRRRPVLAGALLLALSFVLVVPLATSLVVFLVLIAIAAFTLQLGTGLYYVLARELATPGTEGTSLTMLTAIGFSGSFSGPIVGGWLISAYSWSVAFAVFAGVAILGILVLIPVSEAT